MLVSDARCTWWDDIEKAGQLRESKLPCCPFCGSVLFQYNSEADYFRGAPEYEAEGHPGYVVMLKWAKGKCFKSFEELQTAYKESIS